MTKDLVARLAVTIKSLRELMRIHFLNSVTASAVWHSTSNLVHVSNLVCWKRIALRFFVTFWLQIYIRVKYLVGGKQAYQCRQRFLWLTQLDGFVSLP